MFCRQTCICLAHSVYTKCEKDWVVYLQTLSHNWLSPQLCTKVSPHLTKRLVSWPSQVFPKVGVEIQTREANDRDQVVQTWVAYFQRCHCLTVSVCSVGTWEKSRLLILKTNLVAVCSPSSDLGRSQKTLGPADIAIVA